MKKRNFYIMLVCLAALFSACKSATQSAAAVRESTTIERNLEVLDSLKVYLGEVRTANPECDSITKDYMQRLLSGLNSHKTSGENSFGVYYDELQNMIVAHAKLAETLNREKKKDSVVVIREVREVPVEVPVDMPDSDIEKYAKWSGIGFWGLLIAGAAIFVYKKFFIKR